MVSLSLLVVALAPLAVSAQTVVNGQIYTNGLSIVDAPQPKRGAPSFRPRRNTVLTFTSHSTYHGGANLPIAIEISGDGRIDQAASIPGSDKQTRFDLLEIFLVSSQTHLNLTVSEGLGLLQGEQGSTVKHLDYNISSCVPAGNYNLTFYESSHINGTAHYTITALPISIENPNRSGDCTGNQLQDQPQQASALSHSPWLAEDGTPVTYPVTNGAPTKMIGAFVPTLVAFGLLYASM